VLFAVDVSPYATATTLETLRRNTNCVGNSVVQGDLLSGLRLSGQVDVLVFNPPYVPTSEEEEWAGPVVYAWSGGGMGMQVTSRVLDSLHVQPQYSGLTVGRVVCWGETVSCDD
jgi:release factor glutamine methyltransferase